MSVDSTLLWSRDNCTCLLYPTTLSDNVLICGSLYVCGNVIPTSSNSTVGTAYNRYAGVYLSSVIDYEGSLSFASNGCVTMKLTCDGKLGIKKTPNYELDVNGNANFDGNVIINGSLIVCNAIIAPVTSVRAGTTAERDAYFTILSGGEIWMNVDIQQFQLYKIGIGWSILG